MDETVYAHPLHDRQAIRPLETRSDQRGLIQFGAHFALISLTGSATYAARGSIWIIGAMILHGIALIFLFAAEHECIHRTAFRRRWLNDAVAWIAGLLILLPPAYFRYFHFTHHRHTQDPERDPELAAAKPANLNEWMIQVSGWPYWRAEVSLLISHALGRVTAAYAPVRGRAELVTESRVFLAVYAAAAVLSVAAASDALLIYWIVPALLGQPFLRLYLMAEHTGCALSADMLANSRTTLTNAAVRFIAWNMPFHAEHHAFPSVPFHALPAAHRLLRDDLKVISRGYAGVQREIVAGFTHLR
ncbi:MAG: fatty acid desaturase [Dongiaceae bacterium]